MKDKISKIQLLWQRRSRKSIVIHVDLVIAIRLPNHKPIKPLPLGVQCSRYHRIAKTSLHDYDYVKAFRLSDACAEGALIERLPRKIKHGMILAKAVRTTDICTPQSLEHLSLRENIDVTDFVTTYMLKTCLFHLLVESDDLNGDEFDWAVQIYGRLVTYMETKSLPNYHEEDGFVFQCEHSDENMSFECCYKWRVIMSLCRTIYKWLLTNRKALKDAAYGKHLVYNRHSYALKRLSNLICAL